MSIVVEAMPTPAKGFEQSDETAGTREAAATPPIASAYVDIYLQRVQQFQRELANALDLVLPEEEALPQSRYPVVQITFNLALGPEPFTIDEELYEGLFDTYLLYGWPGIQAIEDEIVAVTPKNNSDRAGGTEISIWFPTLTFFRFTRNLLGLLVRDTLANLETQVAVQMILHLSISSIAVTDVWSRQFDFKNTFVKTVTKTFKTDTYEYDVYEYRAQNQGASVALFNALTDSVQARDALEQQQQQLVQLGDQIRATRNKIETNQPTPYSTSERDTLNSVLTQQTMLTALTDGLKKFRDELQKQIAATTPLGLLVIDRLKPGFTQEEMEKVFAEILWQLFNDIDRLGVAIDANLSNVNVIVPGLPPSGSLTVSVVENWNCPIQGPEASVITTALNAVAEQPAYLPLLATPTWEYLVAQGLIEPDSFNYVVAYQFQNTLQQTLAAKAVDDRADNAFWQSFGKATAALSLAALMTPLTAEAAPLLRGASVLADLVLMAYTIRSVTGQLAHFDDLLRDELLDPNAFSIEHLARLGALGAYRERILNDLSLQLPLELLLIAAGERWAFVAETLKWRAYLTDMETLLSDDATGEE